jgi:predicted RNase H-like nuclease
MANVPVLGIDWCKRGWVGVVLHGSEPPAVCLHPDLSALISRVPSESCVAVDMPIGLPDVERDADKLARKYVGCRRSSVFMTPPRRVLKDATDYAQACAIAARILGGSKISQQAWALRANIKTVEELAATQPRIIEIHPEVSFRAMLDEELKYAKNSWNGQALRRNALAREGVVLPDHLDCDAGQVAVADVLDAAAAAWSARRFANGDAAPFPENARPGERQVIWR